MATAATTEWSGVITDTGVDTQTEGWVTLSGLSRSGASDEPLQWWRLIGGVAMIAVLVFVGVAILGAVTARRAAEREAVNDALNITDVLAGSVMQPSVEDALLSGDRAVAAAAVARLDAVVRDRLLSETLVRVKIWTQDGRIVYADEARLIGETFPLDPDELDVFVRPSTKAEVSDLTKPENHFESSSDGKLLEVYRPVWTPSGTPLLFETYSRYDAVTARTTQLWRGFGGITLTSMLLLLVAQAPLTWALVARVRAARSEREAWLDRAVSASDEERRRIAATLHDGAVQELAASAFLVAGAAERARARGDQAAAADLDLAAGTVRSGIGGLRSLLVDIYPPTLQSAGLAAALADLVAPLRSREVAVHLDVPDEISLPERTEAVLFRVAQECLRNIAKHAEATVVEVTLRVPDDPSAEIVLDVADDGIGFDVAQALAHPPDGHFGVRLMSDLSAAAGARLSVRSAHGEGTHYRLEVPQL